MIATNTSFAVVNTNKATLQNSMVENGHIYFVQDTKELFYDYDTQRIQVTDILVLNKEADRTNILFTPLNKFYFVLETSVLWFYKDGNWYDVSKMGDDDAILSLLEDKQDKLIAGDNITIEGNVISATTQTVSSPALNIHYAELLEGIEIESEGIVECDLSELILANKSHLITLSAYVYNVDKATGNESNLMISSDLYQNGDDYNWIDFISVVNPNTSVYGRGSNTINIAISNSKKIYLKNFGSAKLNLKLTLIAHNEINVNLV
jgi:hypothetical protein